MVYKGSLDTLAIVITLIVLLLFLGLIARSMMEFLSAGGDRTTLLLHGGIVFFLLAVLGISLYFAPRAYSVNDGALTIQRYVGSVSYPLSDVKEVTVPEEGDFHGTIRTFGVGGLLGYFGKYYNKNLGHVHYYLTQRKNRVLITMTDGKKIVISPNDLGIVERLKR